MKKASIVATMAAAVALSGCSSTDLKIVATVVAGAAIYSALDSGGSSFSEPWSKCNVRYDSETRREISYERC